MKLYTDFFGDISYGYKSRFTLKQVKKMPHAWLWEQPSNKTSDMKLHEPIIKFSQKLKCYVMIPY